MTDGRRLRILAVVDDYTRECLAPAAADTSISGVRVARELDKIVAVRGRPGGIVSDNGTRPHSSLGWQTPLAFASVCQRPCAQRDRTLSRFEGFAPCPVASDAENTFNHLRTLYAPRG